MNTKFRPFHGWTLSSEMSPLYKEKKKINVMFSFSFNFRGSPFSVDGGEPCQRGYEEDRPVQAAARDPGESRRDGRFGFAHSGAPQRGQDRQNIGQEWGSSGALPLLGNVNKQRGREMRSFETGAVNSHRQGGEFLRKVSSTLQAHID